MQFTRQITLGDYENQYWVEQVVPADFNGDGKVDFLVTRGIDNGISAVSFVFMINQGDGHWVDKSSTFFSGAVPQVYWAPRVLVGDFNGDGHPDVYVPDFGPDNTSANANASNPGGHDQVWLSTPGGTYTTWTYPTAGLSHGITSGDINRDGFTDIVVNGAVNGAIGSYDRILINDGQGNFTDAQSLLPADMRSTNANRLTHFWSLLADVNNDGWQDLVLGGTAGGDLLHPGTQPPSVVLLNDSSGSFANSAPITLPHSPIASESIVNIVSMDVNGDGLLDLLLSVTDSGKTFYTTGFLEVLINQGDGQFIDETSQRYPEQVAGEASAWIKFIKPVDLNHDGADDLVLTGAGGSAYTLGGTVQVLMNDGSGHFARAQSMDSSYFESEGGTAVDLQGSGYADIVGVKTAGSFPATLVAYANPYAPTQGADTIVGGTGKDTLQGLGGDDTIDGGPGIDTAMFTGVRSGYAITIGASVTVTDRTSGRDGTDTLTNVERLWFSDADVALDLGANAGVVAKTLGVVFGRTAVANESIVGICLQLVDAGMSYADLMQLALRAKLGASASNEAVVNLLFTNVTGAAPSAANLIVFKGILDSGAMTQAGFGMVAADTSLNALNIDLVGLASSGLEYLPAA